AAFLVIRKQLVAPVDGAAQRALTISDIASRPRQECQAMIQAIEDLLWRQHVDARGRELDRQGQPVYAAADCRHRTSVVVSQLEAGPGSAGTLHEQLDCLTIRDLPGRRMTGLSRQR